MKVKREADLYPIVEQWVKRHFLCFKTAVTKGLRYSTVDVIGIRDIGGELSGEIQTIAVEVKRKGSPFATTTGQTLGYNVYANRVYLAEARDEPFSLDERDIASHLGVGLIQIRGKTCHEILTSPFYTPINRLNLGLLEVLGLGRCQFCSSFFEIGGIENHWSNMVRGEEPANGVRKAIKKEMGLMYWNMEVAERKRRVGIASIEKGGSKERRFICSECVQGLLAIAPERIDSWFEERTSEKRGD